MERGGEASAGHGPDERAGVEHWSSVPRDGPFLIHPQSDQPNARTVLPLLFERFPPYKRMVETHESLLARFDRRMVSVEILSRQEVPFLQPKGVSRSQSARKSARFHEGIEQRGRAGSLNKELESELTRVAGSTDPNPVFEIRGDDRSDTSFRGDLALRTE